MPKRKVLKSVARSLGDSFTSLMNYAGDDYVLGHILTSARDTGRSELTVDLLSGEAGPEELLTEPVKRAVASYVLRFPDLVRSSGSDRQLVTSAMLTLKFDTSISNARRRLPEPESPYVCTVRIQDDLGKVYETRLTGWWYPETSRRPTLVPSKRRLWRKRRR